MAKKNLKQYEILAPAGDMEMLRTALYYGADAVYLGYTSLGLRAFSGNFDEAGLIEAAKLVHEKDKKLYLTLNVFARNADFANLKPLLSFLIDARIDGVIVSDLGLLGFIREHAPSLSVHVSTQANVTNTYTVREYSKLGAKRIVLARELALSEIREIGDACEGMELEAFVHGAMCVAYSGRCLLSNVLTGRRSNRGECAQSCRLSYKLTEEKSGNEFSIVEDGGSYILNSRDLNMLPHLGALFDAGVTSFKIEGRAKSAYYVANTVNAYRRAADALLRGTAVPETVLSEPYKAGNRGYGTGFYFPEFRDTENRLSAKPISTRMFIGKVTGNFENGVLVEMRNRFKTGDVLEVLSPGPLHNAQIQVEKIEDMSGRSTDDAKRVQELYRLYTDIALMPGDMLRRATD